MPAIIALAGVAILGGGFYARAQEDVWWAAVLWWLCLVIGVVLLVSAIVVMAVWGNIDDKERFVNSSYDRAEGKGRKWDEITDARTAHHDRH